MEAINISETFSLLRRLQTSLSQVFVFYFLKKEQKPFNFDPSRFLYIIQKVSTNFKKRYERVLKILNILRKKKKKTKGTHSRKVINLGMWKGTEYPECQYTCTPISSTVQPSFLIVRIKSTISSSITATTQQKRSLLRSSGLSLFLSTFLLLCAVVTLTTRKGNDS